ncbi:MAG: alcohol dehydrogenase catalytic domain-containing protein [Candidatus Dadabacteria bacterium]|nr:alcohol dehydrogenase catalytic domain-containing protein [Candidatus Dadabacteria bacterium]NIV42235.1 alcohol dehydrogenase catalytic domain-containing protein [Candidatus Dadabacteria bacterium]NIX15327.1 alcohol dehydrogenase catalytic domain-containing protein [Candidatus Dadabacteria bacterium]
MRVAMYYNNSDIRIENISQPVLQSGEILLKTMASGVCGSDTMEWYRVPKAPIVLGHEVAGEIVEVRGDVKDFKPGDRVIATHHVPCNTCYHCLRGNHSACETLRSTHFDPGGFSEYIRIPSINVDRGVLILPNNVSYEQGSFVEPLGCVVRGQRLAGFETGSCVLIIGCGMTGLLNLQYAKVQGAGTIFASDINDFKLRTAKKLGADHILRPDINIGENIKELNEGRLADFIVVNTGAPSAIKQALSLIELGGTILYFAPSDPGYKLTIDFNEVWWKGIKFISSYAAAQADLSVALNLISSGRVNVADMITHRLPLSLTQRGFELAIKSDDSIKVIIEPQS